jgi:uncharacterized membrane protein
MLERDDKAIGYRKVGVSELPATRRVEGLSDAAFSIIITLLVLEIHRPQAEPGRLGEELIAEWSSYVAYAVAFIYVGVVWLNHHYLFDVCVAWTCLLTGSISASSQRRP